ncbi:MAG: tRNA (adenosine(37)-N6)-dimethylallyltransferase MiaA [Sulfurimonas sp.]
MKNDVKQLAIIGPTASGKSDLAIKVALKIDAYILSIDSLSIYKEINIVSAKPSYTKLNAVKHFGIDILNPDEHFSVDIFISLYREVLQECERDAKNLIIVGGTSFYLKSLLQGLSELPVMSESVREVVRQKLTDLKSCYTFLQTLDAKYMQKISSNDSYRIEKTLLIYEASRMKPTEWFESHPPKPIIKNLNIFNIDVDRETLRERISKRSEKMLTMGLIDEVCTLEQKYSRLPHSMGSIGIVEVLEYLDAKVSKVEMIKNISTHTAQLAKRQQTFNKTQFKNITSAHLDKLEDIILQRYL